MIKSGWDTGTRLTHWALAPSLIAYFIWIKHIINERISVEKLIIWLLWKVQQFKTRLCVVCGCVMCVHLHVCAWWKEWVRERQGEIQVPYVFACDFVPVCVCDWPLRRGFRWSWWEQSSWSEPLMSADAETQGWSLQKHMNYSPTALTSTARLNLDKTESVQRRGLDQCVSRCSPFPWTRSVAKLFYNCGANMAATENYVQTHLINSADVSLLCPIHHLAHCFHLTSRKVEQGDILM